MKDLRNLDKLQNTAVLVFDMQHNFVADGAPVTTPGGREIVPRINKPIGIGTPFFSVSLRARSLIVRY